MSPEHAPRPESGRPEARLRALLDEVGTTLRRAAGIEAAVVITAGVAGGLLTAVVGSVLGARPRTLLGLELAVFAATCVVAALRYGRLIGRAYRAPHSVAVWLDGAMGRASARPKERTALVSAVELADGPSPAGESPVLRVAAIDEATEAALAVDRELIVRREAWSSLRLRLLALLAVSITLGIITLVAPRHTANALSAFAVLGHLDDPLTPSTPEPRLGDFRITYRYPAYTERLPETLNDVSGDVRALPGTEVVVETYAKDEVAQASLILVHGEGQDAENTRTGVEADGRRLRATFVVTRGGRYRFSLRTTSGDTLEERSGHAIDLELDEPPEISLLEPTESPLEVNEHDRLKIAFDASDDFGLGEVVVAWRVLGSAREGREKLSAGSRGTRHHAETATFDLTPLALSPGDRVAYTLEARDNDTVNGPKVGASATQELRVYSKNAHHQQVLQLQEQALDELVNILGDNLEAPFEIKPEAEYRKLLAAANGILTRAFGADELLAKTSAAIRKDPLGRKQVAEAFEAARRELARDARKKRQSLGVAEKSLELTKAPERESAAGVKRSQEVMVGSLEKNVVYLADLLNDQRLIDAAELAKQLRAEQQALKEALKAYKNAPDADKRKLLAQAIQDIKRRIQEISEQLAKMRGSIPQDFVNADALKNDSPEAMDRVQKMIEEGDLDGAMAELDRMLSGTENMLSELQSGRQELETREYSEISEQAEKLWKDLEQVEKEQRDLAKSTEKRSREVLERMKQRLGDAGSFVEKQKRRLEQATQNLQRAKPGTHVLEGDTHDQAERKINDALRALEARDFGAAKEMVEQAAEQMMQLEQDTHRRAEQARRFGDLFGGGQSAEMAEREIRKARPILDEVLQDMERLMPSPESLLSKEERAELERQAERQRALKENANKVGEQLERLGRELPIVGQGMRDMVGEAAGAMGEAEGSLGQGDAPSALNQQRRAMDALARLKGELQKMGQQGGGGQGGGVPLPFGQPEGSEGNGTSGEGRDPRSDEKVEIPKPEQYKAPAEFREDILEAAKQGTVEDYREAVRRYYEELVK